MRRRLETGRVLGLPVHVGAFDDVADAILAAAGQSRGGYVCVANVHMLTLARQRPRLAAVMERAAFVVSDGMPLVWALRRKGFDTAERVAGPDLMDELCRAAASGGVPIYLYGGTEATLSVLRAALLGRHPGLRIAGAEAPPVLPDEPERDEEVAARLRMSGARLVFVGLGCPKQEYWMALHAPHIPGVLLGVGAAFDFLAGTRRRAPRRVQRLGLEWLYRLASEPRRLFGRYLISNSLFIYHWVRGRL